MAVLPQHALNAPEPEVCLQRLLQRSMLMQPYHGVIEQQDIGGRCFTDPVKCCGDRADTEHIENRKQNNYRNPGQSAAP